MPRLVEPAKDFGHDLREVADHLHSSHKDGGRDFCFPATGRAARPDIAIAKSNHCNHPLSVE
ncbi:MAG TPA: hypothetical protein K8V94_02335 [Corynebacterium amycolatum]|nr:hypothetical protein [Corynebacterium amycolatum]